VIQEKKSWYQKGKDGAERAKKIDDENKAKREASGTDVRRFWLEPDSSAKVTFLDTPSFFYYEHNLKLDGKWFNFFTSAVEGTPIVTKKGLVPIEEVQIGEEVYTHKGRLKQVVNSFNFETEKDLIALDCSRIKIPFELTFDHRVFGVRKPTFGSGRITRTRDFLQSAPIEELFIEDFNVGDFLFVPKIEGASEEQITKEEAWLFGLYAANGCALGGSKPEEKGIEITLPGRKADVAKKIVEYTQRFGGVSRIKHFNTYIRVQVSSRPVTDIREFFQNNCGEYALHKMIPNSALFGGPEVMRACLEGLFEGDGYYNGLSNASSYTTISSLLAYQVFQLLLRLGKAPSLFKYTPVSDDGYNRYPFYVVSFTDDTQNAPYDCILRDDGMLIKIKGKNRRQYIGKVYDLTVTDDTSFLIGGVAAHNCLQDFDSCPICESGSNASYVLAGTVISHKKFTDKDGNEHNSQKQLFVAKGKARQHLLRQIDRREGDLRGCVYEMSRGTTQTESSVGEDFEFIKRLSQAELLKIAPGKTKEEKMDWLKPYDYAELLKPKSADELRKIVGIGPPVGSDEEEGIFDDTTSNESVDVEDDEIQSIEDLI